MHCPADLHETLGGHRCATPLDTNGYCVNEARHADYKPVPGSSDAVLRASLDAGEIPPSGVSWSQASREWSRRYA